MSSATHPESPSAFSHADVLRVISGISLCILLSALDQTIVAPAIPTIAGDLGGVAGLSWIISAYLLTSTAATPIIGKLSDIHGRRTLMLVSIGVFAVASALCGLAQSMPQLIAARAVQGLGGAGLVAMAHTTIADVVSPRERGRYQIYLSGMWGIASIAGPIVGGAITDHVSWRAIFWVNLPLAVVAFALSRRALAFLPKREGPRPRIDMPGAALLTVGVVSWLLVISQGGEGEGWLSAPALGLLALGAVAFALLAGQERRAADPLLPPRLFANSVVVRGLVLSFCVTLITFATTLLLPLHFQFAQSASAASSGLLMTPFLLASVVFSYAGGHMARRLGRTRGIMAAAFAACAVGLVLLSLIGAGSPTVLTVAWSLLVGGGGGFLLPNITVTVQNAADPRDVGVATGCMLLLRSTGGAFGATMAGAIVAWRLSGPLAAAGLPAATGPAVLQGRAGVLAGLPESARAALLGGLDHGFSLAFLIAAGVAALGLLVALTTSDLALRSR